MQDTQHRQQRVGVGGGGEEGRGGRHRKQVTQGRGEAVSVGLVARLPETSCEAETAAVSAVSETDAFVVL